MKQCPVTTNIKCYVKKTTNEIFPINLMLAYLMLFAALSNAVCLYNAFFFFLLLIFANAFGLHALSWSMDT